MGKTQGQPRSKSGKFQKKQPITDLNNMTEKEYNDYHQEQKINFILSVQQEIANGYNDIERIKKAYKAITGIEPSINTIGMKTEIRNYLP